MHNISGTAVSAFAAQGPERMPAIPLTLQWMESTIWHQEPLDWAGYVYGLLAPRVNVKGRMALVLLVAVVWASGWLLWRAWSVIQTPNEVLVDKLGLDIPPSPLVTLEEISARELQISWKSIDPTGSIQEHHVEVNGRLAGITKKNETAAAISNLQPGTLYNIRIFGVSTGRFQTPSASLHIRTRTDSDDVSTSRGDAIPTVRPMAPRVPPTPTPISAPSMAREQSGGPIGRRGTTGRRASPAAHEIPQPDGSGRQVDEETDGSLVELRQKLKKTQQDTEAADLQLQDEDKEFETQLKDLETKRDELKQLLKERDEASSDLRRQVNKAETANRVAQNEKLKKERLLEHKQNQRHKKKAEMARWEDQTSTMAEEMEGIKTQQAAIERRKQSDIREVRQKIQDEQREVSLLEEENKEKALQIKALEEERQQLNAEEETDESREADRQEQERERRWRERMSNLQASYQQIYRDLQHAHQHYNIARERSAWYEQQRRTTTVSFAPMAPLDMDAVRRGTKPIRRSRHASSHGSNVSSPRGPFSNEGYSMNAHFSTTVNASPTTQGPAFFNPQNGMTLMMPTDNSDTLVDDLEAFSGAPMSPRADALLPADLLGDESADELAPQETDFPRRPTPGGLSNKSYKSQGGQSGNGDARSRSSSSPRSFASPREESIGVVEENHPSSELLEEKAKEDAEEEDPVTAKKQSTMSSLFSFSRQRGKTLANQPPLLGSLKQGQSQSFPRNFDDFDPTAQPRRRLSYGGNWAFPGSSLLSKGQTAREVDKLATTRRAFPSNLNPFSKSSAASLGYDPFAPDASLRAESSPSRPASVYSFDKLPRPSLESQFHAWSMDKTAMRNSPLAPDWMSTISRNHSRRPSMGYGSASNLSLAQTGDDEFLQPHREQRPLQAPIGTRPVSSQRPQTPKLNPAAPSFTMLFSKNREKAKEKAKAKEAAREFDSRSDAENGSPPDSRKSKDTHSIAATASTVESRDSLERTTSSYSAVPSDTTPSKPTFISKITRKASSNKFGSWKNSGVFSRKEPSTPTGTETEEENTTNTSTEHLGRSYESMASTPGDDKDKKASRTSLGSWNFMRKTKKPGAKEDLAASEVGESSERASDVGDDDEH